MDTTLRGAHLVYLDGHPAALMIFTIHRHEASVFVAQDGRLSAISPRSARSGFAMRSAIAGGLRLMDVNDVNPVDLEALMAALVKVQ